MVSFSFAHTRICGVSARRNNPAIPFASVLEEAFLPNPETIADKLRELAAY